jgi:uncharacterized protein YkwD
VPFGTPVIRPFAALLVLFGITLGFVASDATGPHRQAAHAAPDEAVAGFAATPSGNGTWTVTSDGDVTATGDARDFGDMAGQPLSHPIVGIAGTPSGAGYWLVASDGGIFSFGDATFHGSVGGQSLNQPIVGIAGTPSGAGYWLVASDGGIFSFGDATFHGSTGALTLVQPITAIAPTARGAGYWLVASDGGIFSFGDATFHGSVGGQSRGDIVVGMASSGGAGYWLVTAAGEVLAFGDAANYGSAPAGTSGVAGILRSANGYVITSGDGTTIRFTRAGITIDRGTGPAPDRAAAVARQIFDLVNDERAARGLRPLAWDPQLAGLAADWSTAMARTGSLGHRDLQAQIGQPGYLGIYADLAENILDSGSLSANQAHAEWMRSDPHRANELQPGFDSIGVAVVCVDGHAWATENYGRHIGSTAPPVTRGAAPPLGSILANRPGGTAC